MFPVAHIGSMTSGQPENAKPTMICSGVPNVLVNGLSVATIGSNIVPHIRHGHKRPHSGIIAMGSSSVIVNGLPLAYVGCTTSCGDTVLTGCSNVVVGG